MLTHDCFERYERRYARAMAALPERRPWTPDGRAEIVRVLKERLGIRDEWAPTIRTETVRVSEHDGFRLEHLRFVSWPGVRGAAHLYVPTAARQKPSAFVLLCCGHGGNAKLCPLYQAMGRHIARRGAMVLAPDNIGQGERTPMGHRDVVAPFACGTSVQGLIVAETMAWLPWAAADPRVDASRMAAVGNSGGGHLTTFLAALCPELAALSSSGRPCTWDFVARKEKDLCHCSIVPGIVGELEMWHALGCFAPRPLYIFQGATDPLFPPDLFRNVSRKLGTVYRQHGAQERLRAEIVPGEHCWDANRRTLLGDFLSEVLDLPSPEPAADNDEDDLLDAAEGCFDAWPEDAIDIDELARRLTGVDAPSDLKLWDVFEPDIDPEAAEQITVLGDAREILAHFEAYLTAEAE